MPQPIYDNRIVNSPAQNSIEKNLYQRLVDQVALEFRAHMSYINMSVIADSIGLLNLKKLFLQQASEELEHAHKLMDFLSDIGIEYQIGALPSASFLPNEDWTALPSGELTTLLINTALAQEKALGLFIEKTYAEAKDINEFKVQQFLLWYIEEQVEEVAQFGALLSQVNLSTNNLLLFDHSDLMKSLLEE